MRHSDQELWQAVVAQAVALPQVYGRIDFDQMPERFTQGGGGEGIAGFEIDEDVLADPQLVELMAAYTMMGDPVADAYAALIPERGLQTLIAMLRQACAEGVDAVADAPPELARFIAAMEATPDWVDMDLVREGARIERNDYAHLVPFAIRGAFLATFMNKYSALPMAVTGNLTDKLSARRVHETAAFFTLTVMPGALERHGKAFEAAAMVRLMHSMVRINLLTREGMWDSKIYGLPIPQVDQMPAGQINSFLIAYAALREGRESFTPAERARIELARYRCFLLGLPEVLLGTTPREIARLMTARQETLLAAFDEDICGSLVSGTMNTELSHDTSPSGQIERLLERSFSKAFFIRHFLRGDTARARRMGVSYSVIDRKLALLAALRIYSQLRLYRVLADLPVAGAITDERLIRKLEGRLESYGHADFVSDGATYRGARG